MSSLGYKQELPPPGGYESITYKRIPMKPFMTGWGHFVVYGCSLAFGMWWYKRNWREKTRNEIEMLGGHHAIRPLLVAERDRMYLKEIYKNREEERELMKNVPNWKVGHWYDVPIYKSCPPDTWQSPNMDEYYVHAPRKAAFDRHWFGIGSNSTACSPQLVNLYPVNKNV